MSLPHLASFISYSNENVYYFPMPFIDDSQFLKFKLITSDSITTVVRHLLANLTPPGHGKTIEYNFIMVATKHLPFGSRNMRVMRIVMMLKCPVIIINADDLDFSDGSNHIEVKIEDLEKESTCIHEARVNRHIFTNYYSNFDMYIEDTQSYHKRLDGLVTDKYIQVDRDFTYRVLRLGTLRGNVDISNNYRWDNVIRASKILDMSSSSMHRWIVAFVCDAKKREITQNVYTGRRNKFRRKIYKKKKVILIDNPLPFELNLDIFYKYIKNDEFEGKY